MELRSNFMARSASTSLANSAIASPLGRPSGSVSNVTCTTVGILLAGILGGGGSGERGRMGRRE